MHAGQDTQPRRPTHYTQRPGFVAAWMRSENELTMHVEKLMLGMPAAWVTAVRTQWGAKRKADAVEAARWGFETVRKLRKAERAGVLHGDADADICRKAEREARLMGELFDAVAVRVARKLAAMRAPEWVARVTERAQAWAMRADFERRGLVDHLPKLRKPGKAAGITRRGMLARAKCDRWWRRQLRKLHAVMMESAAIGLGLVKAGLRGSCYVSTDSLKRRRGQVARSAAALDATQCVSERMESINLGELASRGVANKGVRRAELMTRISGFEVIGNDCGHAAVMATLTCPSRMHKWRRGDAAMATPNPAYDGTLPSQAQAYLSKQWGKFRSAARHAGLKLYGFRIAEPHHDGCPHWHVLLWHPGVTDKGKDSGEELAKLLDRYFLLNDCPDERGAREYRVRVECIDPSKGSAVAYVAKYVAKNIDGYRVDRDLWGNPAMEASERVEAWASTWRIRQFQQIGGAPVGVWRELRRVHPGNVPMDAPQALHDSLMMVNVTATDAVMGGPNSEADEKQRIRHGWAAYVRAQGGPFAKRAGLAMRVMRDVTGECNKYGDVGAPVTVGVVASGFELVTMGACKFSRPRIDEVESERLAWLVVPKAGEGVAMDAWRHRIAEAEKNERRGLVARALDVAAWTIEHGLNLHARGEAMRPWTRVNNCAQPEQIGGARVVRTRKVGQVFDWKAAKGSGNRERGESVNHERPDHERRQPSGQTDRVHR